MPDPQTLVLDSPLDMHLHLRQEDMLRRIAPHSAATFAGAVIMPNLVPPVTSLNALLAYRAAIAEATTGHRFTPLMTLFFRDYTRGELEAARPHLFAVKLYPEGVTTNSADGVRDLAAHDPVLETMAALGIPLLVHGETHGFVMDREREFMTVYQRLATRHPTLRIVMEHISTREAVELLDRHENLFATVTLHHLLFTLDDMAGGHLNPHLFCKPLLKTPDDRTALQDAVLNGHPKLMFGSDSAPHPVHRKECCGCAAGVFSAPVALPMLAAFFAENQRLDLLENFTGGHARRIHRLNLPAKPVRLTRAAWTVPAQLGGVVPLAAGTELDWTAEAIPVDQGRSA
jgi:dihydroorotase